MIFSFLGIFSIPIIFGVNIILNSLVGPESAYKLAFTTSASVTLSTILMLIILLRKCPEISRKKLGIAGLKITLATVFIKYVLSSGMKMGRLSSYASTVQTLVILIIIAVVSLAVYIVLLYLEGVEEIGDMFGISANRVGHIANQNQLKQSAYGEYQRSKSEYSSKEVDTWRYYEAAIPVFARLLRDNIA